MTTEQHKKQRITLTAVAAGIGILGAITATGRYVLTPWFVTVASDALADETRKLVKEETSGLKDGVKALLQDKIDELALRLEILTAQQARDPAAFSEANATELASVRSRLQKQRDALNAAEPATKPKPAAP